MKSKPPRSLLEDLLACTLALVLVPVAVGFLISCWIVGYDWGLDDGRPDGP